MSYYISHIYMEANTELLASLQLDPILSKGLYHLRILSPTQTSPMPQNLYPENGILVIREVCDPDQVGDAREEANIHQHNFAPIIPWKQLNGPKECNVIFPLDIPTLGFANIYINDKNNPPPPLPFLCLLKHISLTYHVSVAFYHKYIAYGDALANAEYAWFFGKQDSVYIQHADGAYNITQYFDDKSRKSHFAMRNGYDQPILHLITKAFGVTLQRSNDRALYFDGFNWNDYRL